MTIFQLLKDQSGQFWGGFLGGLNQGIRQNQELAQKREQMSLQKKMLEAQLKQMDIGAKLKEREFQSSEALARQFEMAGGGQPTEGPVEASGRGPAPFGGDPLALQRAAAARVNPQAAAAEMFKAPQLINESTMGTLQGGKYTPLPGAGAGQLDAKAMQDLYGLTPEISQRIASLPPKAQERTLDNLRAQKGQEASTQRFEQGQAAMEGRFQRGQEAMESRFTRGMEARAGQDKPLPPQIQNALTQAEGMLEDVQEAKRLHKKKFTGPIGGRLGAIKSATGMGLSQAEADFRAVTARIRNRGRHKEFGAALTQYEGAEALKEFPEESQPDVTISSKLNLMENTLTKNIERIKKNATTPRSQMGYPTPSSVGAGGLPPPPQGWFR